MCCLDVQYVFMYVRILFMYICMFTFFIFSSLIFFVSPVLERKSNLESCPSIRQLNTSCYGKTRSAQSHGDEKSTNT